MKRQWGPDWGTLLVVALRTLGTRASFVLVVVFAMILIAALMEASAPVYFAIVAVGLAAVAGVVTMERRQGVLLTLRGCDTRVGVGAFGMTPAVSARALRALPPDRRMPFAFVSERPESVAAASLRELLDRMARAFGPGGQVVAVAPTRAGSGATTLGLSLAATAAAGGRRVLVIDADMHTMGASRALGMDLERGLWDVLQRDIPLEKAVLEIDYLGIDFLPAGAAKGRLVREPFTQADFGRVIEEYRRMYDVVFVDAPDALSGPDARMTATHANVAVLVARWGRTSVMEARRAVDTISNRAPQTRLGVALVRVAAGSQNLR